MAANINDKFSKVSTGVRPKTTAVAGVRAPSGTTLTCDDLTGWTTDTAVHFVTYKADAQGKVVAGSQTDFKGIVSGNSIINLTITGGNDNGNAVGDIVQALPTAAYAKDLADGLLVAHNQDGSLKTVPSFEATLSSSQSIPATTYTKLNFDQIQHDTTGSYNTSLSRYTVPESGVYSIAITAGVGAGDGGATALYVNGIRRKRSYYTSAVSITYTPLTAITQLNAGDVIEAYVYSLTVVTASSANDQTYFSGVKVA